MKSFPKYDPSKPPRLIAFLSYKARMTHIVREVENPDSVSLICFFFNDDKFHKVLFVYLLRFGSVCVQNCGVFC